MRKPLTAGVLGGFLFVALSGAFLLPQDNPMKVGFIDSQAVLGAYPGTTEAQATFNTENEAWRRQATSMEQEVTRMTQELERQSMAMSQERRSQLQAELQARGVEYQNFINEIWGQDGRAFQRNEELMKPIVDKLNGLLETVGSDEDFDFILDAATAAIVYADPSYDLTPKFIELMGTGDDGTPR